MADRPLLEPLPADLPEDWTSGQIVAPSGADAGLSEQHGYNYLMAQVNAAQRAVNTVNEGFDTISGKRTCRFVIGASAAGWTQADCDFLCDGVDDQAELKEALQALIERGGGEIVVLSGEYNLTSIDLVLSDTNIAITGNPGSTVLNLESNIDIRMGLTGCRCHLFGLTFKAAGEIPRIEFTGVSGDVQCCTFLNVFVSYNDGLDSVSGFRFEHNQIEFDSETVVSNLRGGAVNIYATQENAADGVCVSGNFFRMSAPVPTGGDRYAIYAMTQVTVATIENNTVTCLAENWTIYLRGRVILGNNAISGARLTADGTAVITGNRIEDSLVVAEDFVTVPDGSFKSPLSIVGNQLANTAVFADGPIKITGNSFWNHDEMTSITARKYAPNAHSELAPFVVGNFFVGGSVGVRLLKSDMAKPKMSHALISGNRIFGCETAIQIDSTWSGCMVTDNLTDGQIIDNGSGNIIRLNSNDPGGGSGGTAGVASFNGRAGAVVPQAGDYTAAMVGARPDTWMPTAGDVGAVPAGAVASIQPLTQEEYDALAVKGTTTLYLIGE